MIDEIGRSRSFYVVPVQNLQESCSNTVWIRSGIYTFPHTFFPKPSRCWHHTSMDLRSLFLLASKADTKFERAGKGYVQILLRIYEVDSVQCEHGLNAMEPQLMWK